MGTLLAEVTRIDVGPLSWLLLAAAVVAGVLIALLIVRLTAGRRKKR
jgi:uncharacterized membrane-anchored protein YhcB (DUF1043 family)